MEKPPIVSLLTVGYFDTVLHLIVRVDDDDVVFVQSAKHLSLQAIGGANFDIHPLDDIVDD